MKQDSRKKFENKAKKSRLKTEIKRIETLVAEGEVDKARDHLPTVFKVIDKAAKTNVIHKNTAARKKSRVSRLVNQASK